MGEGVCGHSWASGHSWMLVVELSHEALVVMGGTQGPAHMQTHVKGTTVCVGRQTCSRMVISLALPSGEAKKYGRYCAEAVCLIEPNNAWRSRTILLEYTGENVLRTWTAGQKTCGWMCSAVDGGVYVLHGTATGDLTCAARVGCQCTGYSRDISCSEPDDWYGFGADGMGQGRSQWERPPATQSF